MEVEKTKTPDQEDEIDQQELEEELAKEDDEQKPKTREKEEAKVDDVAAKEAASNRLKYLIQQTEIFAHFMNAPKVKEGSTTKKKKGTKRGSKTEQEEDEEILQEVIEDEEKQSNTHLTVQPAYIQGTMRDYQLQGLNWLIKLYENGINGILADEMGLGKTLQCISLLAWLKESKRINGPHLVIAPKSTLGNWMNEFRKWCPKLSAFKFHGNKDDRTTMKDEHLIQGKYNVIVTSYEIAVIEKAALKKFKWKYLVIDEAHRIKNEKSLLARVVRLYPSQNRLLLTGTPLQNNLHELWALLNFLLPDVFSSSEDFDSWFNLSKSEEQKDIIDKLHKVLRPFLLRRLKSEVERSLPPKKETKLFVALSDMQRNWYQNILVKDIAAINDMIGKKEGNIRLLNLVIQLRKVCNHPYLFDGAEPTPYTNGEHLIENAGKLKLLDKLLPKLNALGSRALIFSQMTRVLDILEDYVVYRGYDYCRIDGQTSGEDRERQIDEFNRPNSPKFIFLLSTRAGGLGINLATADTVILYDSDWNPQADLQAQDRAHRIGQTKPVNVYRLVTEGAIEEKIVERAEAKLHLDALVIQQGRLVDQNKALSKEEMLSMIKFGADEIFKSEGSIITDEDIDLILSRGEAKTQEMNEKLKKNVANVLNMSNFSLDGGSNLYEFQGIDYSEKKLDLWKYKDKFEPSKRERKVNSYGVDNYYRSLMRTSEPKKSGPKQPKQPTIHEFQFFPPRLKELLEKETHAFLKHVEEQNAKEKEKDENNNSEKAEQPVTSEYDLTPEEQAEKEKLLSEGFGEWTRRDFSAFIRGCERYGRDDIKSIATEIETKTEAEVKEYASVFWKRYKEMSDWERLLKTVEKGEGKLRRVDEMADALNAKVAKYKNPWRELKIIYGQNKGKAYTEEEDQFLVCMIQQLGYGKWEELKMEIRKSWQFKFDWFLKSRTPQELNRRVDTLIRLIEKELEDKEGSRKRKLEKSSKKADKNGKSEKTETSDKEKSRSPSPSRESSDKTTSIRKRRKLLKENQENKDKDNININTESPEKKEKEEKSTENNKGGEPMITP